MNKYFIYLFCSIALLGLQKKTAALSKELKDKLAQYGSQEFHFNKTGTDHRVIMTHNAPKDQISIIDSSSPTRSCLLIYFREEDIAYLDSLYIYPNCANPPLSTTEQTGFGSFLLDTALNELKRLEVKQINLTDISSVHCPGKAHVTYSLKKAAFLTKGNTWYGSRGFVPSEPEEERIFAKAKELINSDTIDLLKKVGSSRLSGILKAKLESETNLESDTNEDKLLKNFLSERLAQDCENFANNLEDLIEIFADAHELKHNFIPILFVKKF